MADKVLKFKKQQFINDVLEPISKVTENASLLLTNEGITAICNNDANIILFARCSDIKSDEVIKLNIRDLSRFIRLLECIPQDDIELIISSNTLTFKSVGLKFKYHLAEDAMMSIVKVSIAKILAMNFNSKFLVQKDKIQEILRLSSVVKESNKLYFTISKDSGVQSELTDQQNQQMDSVTVQIGTEFEGNEVFTPLPINLDVLRLINSIKFDKVLVRINTELKYLMFDIQLGNTSLKYIISSLVK